MCVGSEFQVDGAETENARDAKFFVMPVGLARKFVLEERKALGRSSVREKYCSQRASIEEATLLKSPVMDEERMRLVDDFSGCGRCPAIFVYVLF